MLESVNFRRGLQITNARNKLSTNRVHASGGNMFNNRIDTHLIRAGYTVRVVHDGLSISQWLP